MLFRRCAALAIALSAASPTHAGERRELVVFAAASLRESFGAIARTFEREHRGVTVSLALAGSQELRTQIENGATADVFASADSKHMEMLVAAKLVGNPRIFARNEPVIVVPRGNPAGISSLRDLPRARGIVLGIPAVPIGAYALRILEAASRRYGGDFLERVEARVVSREVNVRQVLAKVALGEADAAIVYRTDAAATNAVEAIPIPPELNVVAEYPIAPVASGRQPALAREFIDLVLSPAGQEILGRFGFRPGNGA
jgi:molybdate transport system substrate-binding protein